MYSHLIGDTSTPSQSKRFYDEVCRYFEEEKEEQRDLYEEIELLSLDDAAHYERQIKQHDPKVISTELIPVFS